MPLINNLSTGSVEQLLNNLWANCGTPVDGLRVSRIVKIPSSLMRRLVPERALFYRKSSLEDFEVSEYKPKSTCSPAKKNFIRLLSGRDNAPKNGPQTRLTGGAT